MNIQRRAEELKAEIAAKVVVDTAIDKAWVIKNLRENAERCM